MRILSLSGGGVRGVFQARFIMRLEAKLGESIHNKVDLFAGTSTGAITAGLLAAGVDAARVYELFVHIAQQVFRPRFASAIRRGGRYEANRLNQALLEVVGNRTLSALEKPVLLTSSAVDTHAAKTFSSQGDPNISLVDAIMASTAAPTYFPPRRIVGDNRGFYDGGLWANDPIDVAIACANRELAASTNDMRVLSIGTGRVGAGSEIADLERMRTLSVRTVRSIWDMTASLQASASASLAERRLGAGAIIRVNPYLPSWIALDEVSKAIRILPGIADQEFEQMGDSAVNMLTARSTSPLTNQVPEIAIRGIQVANMTRFIPARRYYSEFRLGAGSISAYVSQAKHEIIMVSVNLASGVEMEKIRRTFKTLLSRTQDIPNITISLLNPDLDYLMKSLCNHLEKNSDELATSIRASLASLRALRSELTSSLQNRLHVRVHNTIPCASAILLDASFTTGVIQLETNSYKSASIDSFGFEVGYGSDFYYTLQRAYNDLIEDGESREED